MEAMLKFLIIIMLFFVILNSGIIDYIKKKFKLNEPFSKTTNIVLLGDNFFAYQSILSIQTSEDSSSIKQIRNSYIIPYYSSIWGLDYSKVPRFWGKMNTELLV